MSTSSWESLLTNAADLLRSAQRVAVLTGAGVSAESGIPTFRGLGGMWEGHSLDEVATPAGFRRNPKLVWQFYNARRANLRAVEPNPAHFALAGLERRLGSGFSLITQNVDGLHQSAGSLRVLEIHGSLRRVRCTHCSYREDRGDEELPEMPRCPDCQSLLRPDVVWFHEMLPEATWQSAAEAVATCEVLLVVGTSAVVYPAAGLISTAQRIGAGVIEVNLTPTDASAANNVGLFGPAGQVLPRLMELLG